MADRYPLIANSQTNKIEELASGDNLNLQNSGIVGATTITSQKFVGDLEGIADFSNSLLNGANILSGTISSQRLSGYYPIDVEFAETADAGGLIDGIVPRNVLDGTYDIDITGTAQTANFLQDAGNINEGVISADRLTGVYNISITGTAATVASLIPGTYDINITGSSQYAQVAGISTNSSNLNVTTSNSTGIVYPTFAVGSGYTNISIGSSLTYIPSTGRFGINTTSPSYNLDVRGDISFNNRLFIFAPPVEVKTATGTLSSSSLIGVDTSSLQLGDFVVDVPQLRIFDNTRIISIGASSITISPNHVVAGSEVRTLSFSRNSPQSSGLPGQILVSGGATSPASWGDFSDFVDVGVENTTEDATYNLIITKQTDGPADLKVDSSGLNYNPGTNTLSVGGTTSVVTADTIIASSFIGDGVALTGIVTQITAGIGVNVKPINGKGVVEVEAYRPTGKTIFVNQNGNDDNSGLSENNAKRTIKAAAKIAVFGDTIKVYPGVYVEENPIILKKTVAVEGTELRNCVVTPRYPYLDLFQVNNGCHITDLSFIGPDMTDGAAVVALQTLEGVAVDRYFDAARMIRLNLDYIANETVGFLTSGFSGFAGNHREQDAARLIDSNIDFIAAEAVGFLTSPSGLNFTVPAPGTTEDCADDIKDIFRAISYDLKANSNKKSIGAALSYFGPSGELLHITGVGVSEATIQTLDYAVGIAYSVINNVGPTTSYQSGVGSISQTFNPSVIQVEGGCVAVGTTISQLVGIITSAISVGSTSTFPDIRYGVTLESQDCADDVKDIWKCIIHDITRGGNSRCVDAGKAYYDENWNLIPQILKNPGEVQQTVASLDYSFNVARAIINNVSWGGYPVGLGTTVINASYNEITGITTITADSHGLVRDDAVKITGLGFTCPSGPGIVTYPSGAFGYIFNVLNIIDEDNFEVVVGQSTLPHTYVSGGVIQKYTNFNHNFYQVKDLGIQKDPLTGFNNAINGCANVVSALHSCVGIVTNIVGFGSTAFSSVGIRTSYPGNSGIGFTSTIGITSAIYDEVSGRTTIIAPGINAIAGEPIELRELAFSCASNGSGISTQVFPSGRFGYDFFIDKVNTDGSFDVYVGPSTLPHTYEGGGIIVDRTVSITTTVYDHTTGITTITATGASIETGDLIRIRGLEFSCPSGSGTTTIYPTGNNGFDFRVLDIVTDKPVAITSAIYDNSTGITTITAPGIDVTYDGIVEIRGLEFSCTSGAATTTLYPTGNNGFEFRVLSAIGSTFTVNVGPSTIPHTYVSGGVAIDRTNTANDTFTINVGPSTIPHTYVSGGIVIPPFSRGVGPITQGPYVRNCTNFIPKSIGMKIDGFAAEPGDQDDIGVTGTMSVDSYTQYNQGGIGVSITNGAYAQLVSIFTICDDIAIFTGSGGQCDVTNSNSSFGRYGLVSQGVGDLETKSIYRYTGTVNKTADAEQSIIEVRDIGNYRPYDGQALYFGELFYSVQRIEVLDGGSNYTSPPGVIIDAPPSGLNGIQAEAISNIQNGSVISIDLISAGTQYRTPPKITFSGGGGSGASAKAIIEPIYYTIESATLPSSGISTITLNNNINNTVSTGTTVYFSRLSLQIISSHSFEWVGSGNDINKAKPALGGVAIQENEVVKLNGGEVVYTSTDQAGNFRIGDDVVINQLTGTISGRTFNQSLLNTVTPLIIALSN